MMRSGTLLNVATHISEALRRRLDALVRPDVKTLNRTWPVFQLCGYSGVALAITVALGLALAQGRAPWVIGAIVLAAAGTFFTQALVAKVITGEEKLVFYRHAIVFMGVAVLLLRLLEQPALPYLDATILGVGAFLACGRIGCLMVGCCHGRPQRWGVRYRAEHAVAGFTSSYVGVRLFPVQALESLWVSCITVVGSLMVLAKSPAGTALAWFVVAYGAGRFWIELVRGDAARGYLWGFSEAQWTSVILLGAVAAAELAGTLTLHIWHLGVAAAIALAMAALAISRRLRGARYQILHPHHIMQVAQIVADSVDSPAPTPKKPAPAVQLASTSLGIRISAGRVHGAAGWICHYTFSCSAQVMDVESAGVLAGLIRRLKHPAGPVELVERQRGVFQLLIYPPAG